MLTFEVTALAGGTPPARAAAGAKNRPSGGRGAGGNGI